jgi:hypothetical protein
LDAVPAVLSPVSNAPPSGTDVRPPVFSTGRTAAPRSSKDPASSGSYAGKVQASAGVMAPLRSATRLLKNACRVHNGEKPLDGKEVKMPGDNSCLFHSIAHGLGGGVTHVSLRAETCAFIESNPGLMIEDKPLRDWIEWETEMTVSDYCKHMLKPASWGGAIEEAVIARLYGVCIIVGSVHSDGLFHLLYRFNASSSPARKDVYITYNRTNHYNAFESSGPIDSAATADVKTLLGVSTPPPPLMPPPPMRATKAAHNTAHNNKHDRVRHQSPRALAALCPACGLRSRDPSFHRARVWPHHS